MNELTLQDKLRSAHTKRWGIVNTGRVQNVAEHSFLVQLIAVELSRAIKYSNSNGGPFNTEKEFQIMRWAMWHDLPEIRTGDINSAVKIHLKKACGEHTLKNIEYSYSAEYEAIDKSTYGTVKDLVKLADYMESLNFLSEEGRGRHATEVASLLFDQMWDHFRKIKASSPSFEWDNLIPLMRVTCPNGSSGVSLIGENGGAI